MSGKSGCVPAYLGMPLDLLGGGSLEGFLYRGGVVRSQILPSVHTHTHTHRTTDSRVPVQNTFFICGVWLELDTSPYASPIQHVSACSSLQRPAHIPRTKIQKFKRITCLCSKQRNASIRSSQKENALILRNVCV